MQKKFFFIVFLYHIQILTLNNNFDDLKKHLNDELELCFTQQYLTPKKINNEIWIAKSIKENLIIPSYIIKKISINPPFYKKLVDQIALKAQTQFVIIKKTILKTYKNELRNKIKNLLDIIEYQIALGNDIFRYPNRNILENALNDLKESIYLNNKDKFNEIDILIKNIKDLYFIIRQPLEIDNQIHAIDYFKKLRLKSIQEIKLDQIISLHKILLKNIDDKIAGVFRKGPANVNFFYDDFPEFNEIEDEMYNFMQWLKKYNLKNDINFAADIHLKFVFIHPFVDGNGRTARFLMNFVLNQNYYSSFFASKFNPNYIDYYNTIGESHKNKKNLFKVFLASKITRVNSEKN